MSLADKRAQLDRVATMLLSRQKELEYESKRAGMTTEEQSLLALQRAQASPPEPQCCWPELLSLASVPSFSLGARLFRLETLLPLPTLCPRQMERAVADQVAEERRVLLAAKTAAMQHEVGREVAAAAAAQMKSSTPITASRAAVAVPMAVDMGLSALDEVMIEPPLSSTKSPKLPNPSSSLLHSSDADAAAPDAVRQLQQSLQALISNASPQLSGTAWQRQYESQLQQQQQQLHDLMAMLSSAQATPPRASPDTRRQQQHEPEGGSANQMLLSRARFFISQQKRYIRERQAVVQQAREEWKAGVAAAEAEADPAVRMQQEQALRRLKASLEEQVCSHRRPYLSF